MYLKGTGFLLTFPFMIFVPLWCCYPRRIPWKRDILDVSAYDPSRDYRRRVSTVASQSEQTRVSKTLLQEGLWM